MLVDTVNETEVPTEVSSLDIEAELHCLTEENEVVEIMEKYFYIASLTILGIFEAELLLLLLVLGCYGFFRNFGYIFDVFIITTSLSLEVLLHNTEAGSAVGILIAARVWRLVRIGHGIMYSSQTRRKAVGEMLDVADSNVSIGQLQFERKIEAMEDMDGEDVQGGIFHQQQQEMEEIKKLETLI